MSEPSPEAAPEPVLVVRGGDIGAGMKYARNNAGAVHAEYGRYGLCVASLPGATVEDLVRTRPIRHNSLQVSDVERLAAGGWEVSQEPGKSPVECIVWLPDRDEETLKRLNQCFGAPIENPVPQDER